MKNLKFQDFPVKENLLISFIDLTNFTSITSKMDDIETFNYISKFYEIVGDEIENNGGKVLKFIGDSALIIFPANLVDQGVTSLYNLKQKVDKYNKELNLNSQLIVKCHFGISAIGMLGTKNEKRPEIIGKEVNFTATLKSNGFAMSNETFRKLKPETRKLFKKHTPPITYIPLEEHHKN